MMNFLWVLAALFVGLWGVGIAFHFAGGGLIHGLLVLAIIAVALRLSAGRRVV